MRESNLTSPSDRRLVIRTGVHLADAVRSDDCDISGDAVNVASRVEAPADERGVRITRQEYDQVHNKLEVPAQSVGPWRLKNLSAPLELLRVAMPWIGRGSRSPEKGRVRLRPAAASPYQIALVSFTLGDVDEGFRWLRVPYDAHDGGWSG